MVGGLGGVGPDDGGPQRIQQVVAGADQRPLSFHLLGSAQQKLPEPSAPLDLAEYRVHCGHALRMALSTPLGL